MNFIRKAIQGEADEFTHRQFVRYGKGEFERLLFDIKVYTGNFSVKASFDFANELFGMIAENIKDEADLKGRIAASSDFEKEIGEIGLNVVGYSKRGKIYTAEFDCQASPEQLRQIFEKFRCNPLLLSVSSKEFSLRVKTSIPKIGGKVKDNFCSASLPIALLNEFAFDFPSPVFRQAKIVHKIIIDEIIIPKEYENDFEKARLNAKRKGSIVRIMNIDGREIKKEYKIEV
ncbi:hypothetical protein HZB88_02250 [archaeon]|nr:hypothetical protein [archaeon]